MSRLHCTNRGGNESTYEQCVVKSCNKVLHFARPNADRPRGGASLHIWLYIYYFGFWIYCGIRLRRTLPKTPPLPPSRGEKNVLVSVLTSCASAVRSRAVIVVVWALTTVVGLQAVAAEPTTNNYYSTAIAVQCTRIVQIVTICNCYRRIVVVKCRDDRTRGYIRNGLGATTATAVADAAPPQISVGAQRLKIHTLCRRVVPTCPLYMLCSRATRNYCILCRPSASSPSPGFFFVIIFFLARACPERTAARVGFLASSV